MITDKLLNELRYKSEGTDLDFKSTQYRFAGGNDDEKSEILKDILAIANAWNSGTGYILLGFKDDRPNLAQVAGITENIDDSRLQQFINSKVKPKLAFRYEEHLYEGKTIGVIAIPKQKRPFFVAKAYGKLGKNVVYVRRGSSTDEADPSEVAAMALADSGRNQVHLTLSILTQNNKELPKLFEHIYLQFPKDLPDYESQPQRITSTDFSIKSSMWHDNRSFWREYSEYARVVAAMVQLKFSLKNISEISSSNSKLEVSVEPLDGQSFEMLSGRHLPDEPKRQWYTLESFRNLPEILNHQDRQLVIDDDRESPICHVRFGSLLPGEECVSSDTFVILPSGPGKIRLHFRVLAEELPTPQCSSILIETAGDIKYLELKELKEMYYELASLRKKSEKKE